MYMCINVSLCICLEIIVNFSGWSDRFYIIINKDHHSNINLLGVNTHPCPDIYGDLAVTCVATPHSITLKS